MQFLTVRECRGHFHDHPEYYSLLSPSAPSNASCAAAAGAPYCIRAHNLSMDSADPHRPAPKPNPLSPCNPLSISPCSGWRVGGVPGKGPWQAQLCMSSMEMRAAMIARAKEKLRWDKAAFGDIKYIAVSWRTNSAAYMDHTDYQHMLIISMIHNQHMSNGRTLMQAVLVTPRAELPWCLRWRITTRLER